MAWSDVAANVLMNTAGAAKFVFGEFKDAFSDASKEIQEEELIEKIGVSQKEINELPEKRKEFKENRISLIPYAKEMTYYTGNPVINQNTGMIKHVPTADEIRNQEIFQKYPFLLNEDNLPDTLFEGDINNNEDVFIYTHSEMYKKEKPSTERTSKYDTYKAPTAFARGYFRSVLEEAKYLDQQNMDVEYKEQIEEDYTDRLFVNFSEGEFHRANSYYKNNGTRLAQNCRRSETSVNNKYLSPEDIYSIRMSKMRSDQTQLSDQELRNAFRYHLRKRESLFSASFRPDYFMELAPLRAFDYEDAKQFMYSPTFVNRIVRPLVSRYKVAKYIYEGNYRDTRPDGLTNEQRAEIDRQNMKRAEERKRAEEEAARQLEIENERIRRKNEAAIHELRMRQPVYIPIIHEHHYYHR